MKLKLADEENANVETPKFHFADEPEEKNTEPDTFKSNDPPVTKNPWDFKSENEPIVISSTNGPLIFEDENAIEENAVLKISKIVLYITIAATICFYLFLATGNSADIVSKMYKWNMVPSFCNLIILIDAILVSVLYEKKVSLVIWAWFLPFLHPAKRNRHMKGYVGYAGWISFALGAACAAVIGVMLNGFFTYGQVALIEDDTIRHAAISVMEQPITPDVTLGDKLTTNAYILDVEAQNQSNMEVVVFSVLGSTYIENNTFMLTGQQNIPTQLTFIKKSGASTYELNSVQLNNTKLSSYYLDYYKENILFQ